MTSIKLCGMVFMAEEEKILDSTYKKREKKWDFVHENYCNHNIQYSPLSSVISWQYFFQLDSSPESNLLYF